MTTLLEEVAGRGRPASGAFEVRPLTFRIGAELGGLDLSAELADEVIADVRAALLAYRVVFFRDQRIGIDEQSAFARRFGELTTGHPTLPGPDGQPHVFELDSLEGARADHWHTDVTFTDRPPAASVLRAVVIPPYGGDTIWANTVAAYAGLPEPLQRLVDGLRAVHTNAYDYANPKYADDPARQRHLQTFVSTVFETEHPVVRVHPETGERSLLLGGFAQRIVGLGSSESRDLIRSLQQRVTSPENTVRWRWRAGDVVMWDNRATQHYAVNDYGDTHRVVQRVTVAGERPIGVDGRHSEALVGDAGYYSALVEV